MSSNPPVRFADHLRGANSLPRFDAADAPDAATPENGGTAAKSWEATDLSASDFADEVARRFHLPRIALPDLLAAQSLAKHFSRRFLRETMVFPFQSAQHRACLAVADPGETAARRAAELVLGGEIDMVVASFEDIATALNRLAGDAEVLARDGDEDLPPREDDIESLRDLASGRRWCEPSTIFSNWPSSCAPATFMSKPCAPGFRFGCASTAC
jgi:general secretion pathway protein E